jgi:glycosyltransferase involved in cell wall biosynthesis
MVYRLAHQMRILLVSHKFPPHSLGGVEIYTYNLAKSLRARHQVAVFYRHDDGDASPFAVHDEDVDGILTRRVSCNPSGLTASVVGEFLGTFLNRQIEDSFADFLAKFQPDLIHIQHVMALSARLLHLARESAAPVILTLHDYWFICGNSQLIWPDAQTCRGKALGMNCVRCAAAARFPSPLVHWLRLPIAPIFVYRDRLVGHAAGQAHQLISPSQFLIDQYVAAGFPAKRFRYLENGIPVERIRRFSWHPSDGPLRVTFLGSLAWQKGVHVLVEAFNGLPEGVARLCIWGDPSVFPGYTDTLRQMSSHPDIQFMGRIANDRVGEVLADSDVMVVPSLWYENSPVVIQEARAAGVPVVASGHGALAEKVRHGVDGLLFPPGDAAALHQVLHQISAKPELLVSLRQNLPAPMDMDEHVRELEEIYHRLMPAGQP